jgi:uncharacterized iron-regulated protein
MTSLHLRLFLGVLAGFAAAGVGRADEAAGKQAELEAAVKQLVPQVEKARGLKFNKPVVAKILPRPAAGAAGVQGFYDLKKKTLFVYDDVKNNYWKGVLVHEMVHVLQDQNFGLAKLHQANIGGDAELARAALVEGDAVLTMIEVLQAEQPHVKHMLSGQLDKAKNLQNAFLYGQGARYVQALKQRGGWAAVNFRYRLPPESTAAVLHPGERISPVNLGGGEPVGELGLIRLLRGQPATSALAVQASAGWRGERVVEEGASRGWVVAFAAPEQAGRFFRALCTLRTAEHPKYKTTADEAARRVVVSDKGAVRGILLRGARVLELTAADARAYQALLDRTLGPPRMHIYSAKDKKTLTFGQLADRLMEGDLVCIGETHDSELHHRVQLMLIKALYARDERLGVGMEMFQRPYQKTLDRYVRGAVNEETFLEDSDYHKRWGFDWGLYRPIAEFCRRNQVPLAALNVAEELRRKVSKSGYDKLSGPEKKELGAVDFQVKEHRSHWFDKLGNMHGHGKMSKEAQERMYQVMTIWDEYMADSAAKFQQERGLRRMVVLAGSGHIDFGFGIPDRAAKRTKGKALTVRILLGGDPAKVAADPRADFVVTVW